eukprot:1317472-Amorphochlora_amoeboformis.AAC.1
MQVRILLQHPHGTQPPPPFPPNTPNPSHHQGVVRITPSPPLLNTSPTLTLIPILANALNLTQS